MANERLRPRPFNSSTGWESFIIYLILIAISVFATLFFSNIHYNAQLLQQTQTINNLQLENSNQQADIKVLTSLTNSQINCYVLMSTYAQQQCQQHNKSLN